MLSKTVFVDSVAIESVTHSPVIMLIKNKLIEEPAAPARVIDFYHKTCQWKTGKRILVIKFSVFI